MATLYTLPASLGWVNEGEGKARRESKHEININLSFMGVPFFFKRGQSLFLEGLSPFTVS